MAEVWLGADEVLGRQVALKLLHPNLAHDRTFVERLQREAVAVARINHPGIVAVFDTVNDAGYEAVVMEYVPGQNLRQLLDSRGRLEIDETILLGSSLADALNAAHDAGIVHRDVKPGNVLLTPEGRVKLTDFGIATAMLAVDELSDQGILLGTAKYVAPEQVQGHLVDGRTDLYALAIVLYECLTGVVPFDGPDERSVALARLRQPAPPLRRLRPDVPPELDHLLATTLRSRPSDRPATAAIFGAALNRITLAAPVEPAPPAPTDTTHHVPVDGTRAYPVDNTPPFGTDAPAAADRAGAPGRQRAARPAAAEVLRTNQRRASWTVGGLVAAALVTALVLIGLAQRDGRSGATDIAGPTATTVAELATTVASPTVLQAPPVAAGHRHHRQRRGVRPRTRRRPGAPRAAGPPHRRADRHDVVDLVLPPADHGTQGRRRPGLLAVGPGTRQRPGPHLADARVVGVGLRRRRGRRTAPRLGLAGR